MKIPFVLPVSHNAYEIEIVKIFKHIPELIFANIVVKYISF